MQWHWIADDVAAAAARGIFGANSSFRVKYRTGGKVEFLFFGGFLLVLVGLSFWRAGWALGYHSMEFGQFSDVS